MSKGDYRSKGKIHQNRSGKTQTPAQKKAAARKKKRAKISTAAKGIAADAQAPVEESGQHAAAVSAGAAQSVRNRQSRPGRAQQYIKNRSA